MPTAYNYGDQHIFTMDSKDKTINIRAQNNEQLIFNGTLNGSIDFPISTKGTIPGVPTTTYQKLSQTSFNDFFLISGFGTRVALNKDTTRFVDVPELMTVTDGLDGISESYETSIFYKSDGTNFTFQGNMDNTCISNPANVSMPQLSLIPSLFSKTAMLSYNDQCLDNAPRRNTEYQIELTPDRQYSQTGSTFTNTDIPLGLLSSTALSSDGLRLVIGVRGSNNAYVYNRINSTSPWVQEGPVLTGTGATGSPAFGQSVSINSDGSYIAVGGTTDNANVGAVWVFNRVGTTWTQQGSKLVGTGYTGGTVQGVGLSINSDGSYIAVGGSGDNSSVGATWIFNRSGSTWTQQGTKLVGTGNTGACVQGTSVALSGVGDRVVIGAPSDNTGGYHTGAMWIFSRSGSTWTQEGSKLKTVSVFYPSKSLGNVVCIDSTGTTILGKSLAFNSSFGSGFMWKRTGTTWNYLQRVSGNSGPGAVTAELQTTSLAISNDGNYIAATAPGKNLIYVYALYDGFYYQIQAISCTSATRNNLGISNDGSSIVTVHSDTGVVTTFGVSGTFNRMRAYTILPRPGYPRMIGTGTVVSSSYFINYGAPSIGGTYEPGQNGAFCQRVSDGGGAYGSGPFYEFGTAYGPGSIPEMCRSGSIWQDGLTRGGYCCWVNTSGVLRIYTFNQIGMIGLQATINTFNFKKVVITETLIIVSDNTNLEDVHVFTRAGSYMATIDNVDPIIDFDIYGSYLVLCDNVDGISIINVTQYSIDLVKTILKSTYSPSNNQTSISINSRFIAVGTPDMDTGNGAIHIFGYVPAVPVPTPTTYFIDVDSKGFVIDPSLMITGTEDPANLLTGSLRVPNGGISTKKIFANTAVINSGTISGVTVSGPLSTFTNSVSGNSTISSLVTTNSTMSNLVITNTLNWNTRPYFECYGTTQSIPTTTPTNLVGLWNTPTVITAMSWNAGTGILSVLSDGIYQINFWIMFANNGSEFRGGGMRVNGTGEVWMSNANAYAGNVWSGGVSTSRYLTGASQIQFFARQGSGGNLNVINGYVSVYKV